MIVKHSVTLHGHRTSFSLEEEFFSILKQIAAEKNVSLAELIAETDDKRREGENLSSALRIRVLNRALGKS